MMDDENQTEVKKSAPVVRKSTPVVIFVALVVLVMFFTIIPMYNEFITKPYIDRLNSSNKKMSEMVSGKIDNDINFKQALLESISYMNPMVDPSISEQIVDVTISESKKYKFPPLLILCIINEESGFNPLAKNGLGAVGLMQVIPEYHRKKIDRRKLKSHEIYFIKNNIILGAEVLEEYFNETGDMSKALQRYVGATVRDNAKQYIQNITDNYITLDVMMFLKKRKQEHIKSLSDNPFYGGSSR